MSVMAKKIVLAVLPVFAWASAQAGDKIPISAVPMQVRAAVQNYAPGAQLIEARVSPDTHYKRIYACTYFRNVHLGSIKLGARGQLLDIDEALVNDDLPHAVRQKVRSETKGGLIKSIRLDALRPRGLSSEGLLREIDQYRNLTRLDAHRPYRRTKSQSRLVTLPGDAT